MLERTSTDALLSREPPRTTEFARFKRVFFSRPVVVVGLVILSMMAFVAIFAPWIAPYDPYQQDLGNNLLQPSGSHFLGTDGYGRDSLSRLMYGARTALAIGFAGAAISALIGTSLGVLAGYFGGVTSMVIMRFIDTLMAFPLLLNALVIAAVLGGGINNVIIAVGIAMIPSYARVMNGQTLSIKQNDYILAQRAIGSGNGRIIFRHIFPNAFPAILVLVTLELGQIILTEAMLSYLGIGIEAPGAAWGGMVKDGYRYLFTHPVLSFAPGVAIILVVFAFNMVGDGLRDATDPRLRGTL